MPDRLLWVVLAYLVSLATPAHAQLGVLGRTPEGGQPFPNFATPATKFAGNPIINENNLPSYGRNQLYDFQALVNPADQTQILIFMSALAGTTAAGQQIALMTAPVTDPYNWRDRGVIFSYSGSGFDAAGVRLGSMIYDSGTFYLFYTGCPDGSYINCGIGLATAKRPTGPWTRHGQILAYNGNGGTDGVSLDCMAVLHDDDGTWVGIYTYRGSDAAPLGFRAATASSPTGPWTKVNVGTDLLGDGGAHYWEFHHLLKDRTRGIYYLAFERGGPESSNIPYQSFAASNTSSPTTPYTILNDGTPIIPVGMQPCSGGEWDACHTATPGVLTLGNGNPVMIDGNFLGFYCGAGDRLEPFYLNKWSPAMVKWAVQ
jgi:hypothetical protein